MKRLSVVILILCASVGWAQTTYQRGVSSADFANVANDTLGWFNVKAYGAKGDSTGNDATAIQAAINAASTAGGGVVYFPTGEYLITSTLQMKSYVKLLGSSPVATLITGNVRLFRVGNGETDWGMESLQFKPWGGEAIYIPGTSTFWHIIDCDFNQQATGYAAIRADSATSDIENSVISRCSFSMTLTNTKPLIQWRGTGGTINQNTIENCLFQANYNESQYMIDISDSSNNYCFGNTFRNLCFETCEGGAMKLNSMNAGIAENCIVYDMADTVNNDLFYVGRYSAGTALSKNFTMTGCGFVGTATMLSGKYHFRTDASTNVLMLNCFGTPTNASLYEAASTMVFGTSDITTSSDDPLTIMGSYRVQLRYLPTYDDNAAAVGGGLDKGTLYRTAAGAVRIVTE